MGTGQDRCQLPRGHDAITRSTISANFTPTRGGGLYVGYSQAFTIDSSTISGNGGSGTEGGGIFAYAPQGPFIVRNSTLYGNRASRGGGIYSLNYYDQPGRIENSTIVANIGMGGGGGIYRFGFDGTGPGYEGPDDLSISSSVVAGNTAGAATGSLGGPDLAQRHVSTGSFITDHSLIGATAGNAASATAAATAQRRRHRAPGALG